MWLIIEGVLSSQKPFQQGSLRGTQSEAKETEAISQFLGITTVRLPRSRWSLAMTDTCNGADHPLWGYLPHCFPCPGVLVRQCSSFFQDTSIESTSYIAHVRKILASDVHYSQFILEDSPAHYIDSNVLWSRH